MKKITAFLLSLIFILSSCPVLAANSRIEPDNEILEKLRLLDYLEIIDAEGFDKDKKVTRGEFTAAVINAMNVEAQIGEPVFTDVSKNTSYAAEINTAARMGLVSGSGDGQFMPQDNILFSQGLKILEDAMGYTPYAALYGAYPNGYMQVAKDIKLTAGLKLHNDDVLYLDEAISIIYQALHTYTVNSGAEYAITPEGIKQKLQKSDKTFVEESFDMKTTKGIVTMTYVSGLDCPAEFGKGNIEIDGIRYETICDETEKLLGRCVIAYINEDDVVEFMGTFEEDNEVFEIAGDKVHYFKNGKIYYENENGVLKTISLEKNFLVIYNYGYVRAFTPDILCPKNGSVTVLDTGDGNNIVYVFNYTDVVLGKVDEQEGKYTAFDRYTKNSVVFESNGTAPYSSLYDSEANKADYAALLDLEALDVISCLIPQSGNYVEGYMMTKHVVGEITAIDTGDYYTTLTINETPVKVLSTAEDIAALRIGDSIETVKGYAGISSFVHCEVLDGGQYGYIISYKLVNNDTERIKIKMLTSLNGIESYYSTQKGIRINDASWSEAEDVKNFFDTNSVGLVRFELNYLGEISKLYTPKDVSVTNKDNDFRKVITLNNEVYRYRSFRGKLIVTPKTTIFTIPQSAANKGNEDYYGLIKYSYFIDTSSYTLDAYTSNSNNAVPEVLIVKSDAAKDGNVGADAFVVTDVKQTLDADDEPIYKVRTENGSRIYDLECLPQDFPAGLESGDIIRYATDVDGYMKKVHLMYDFSQNMLFDAAGADAGNCLEIGNETGIFKEMRMTKVGIYKHDTESLSAIQGEITANPDPSTIENYTSEGVVMVYDTANNTLRVGSSDDLVDYVVAGGSYTRAVLYSRWGQPKYIYIYE